MSDHSLFQQKLAPNTLSRYDRRKLEGMTQFGPDEDGFTVFVTPAAVRAMYKGTRDQEPREALGMLMGRAYEDEKGYFTVVSDAVYARDVKSSRSHVELSSEEMHRLRKDAKHKHPESDFVGWTHSHRNFVGYSAVDLKEQKTWTEDYHVGILTFMDSIIGTRESPWAVAYRGPTAQMLSLTIDATPLAKERENAANTTFREQTGAADVASKRSWSLRNISQPFFLLLLTITIALGIFLGNVASQFFLASHPVASTTGLLWDCDQLTGKSPLKVTCTGPVGPDIQGWLWDFGDGTTLNKSFVTHVYANPGIYSVKLTVFSTVSTLSAGSLNITVVAPTASPIHTG